MGRMIDDERLGMWCRVRAEKFVVDGGMNRVVENEKRLRMVEDEWMERLDDSGWH